MTIGAEILWDRKNAGHVAATDSIGSARGADTFSILVGRFVD